MTKKLFVQAISKFGTGLVLIALLLFLFLSMGLVLGSPISFAILICYLPIIAKRIRNEEEVLAQGLEGYAEYRDKVKYKVIPLIW